MPWPRSLCSWTISFCNSLYSADGHAWITEANTTDYIEKAKANSVWGNNPLSYSSSGFLWTHVLNHGLTFENFGEFDYASFEPKLSYGEIYQGMLEGKLPVKLKSKRWNPRAPALHGQGFSGLEPRHSRRAAGRCLYPEAQAA